MKSAQKPHFEEQLERECQRHVSIVMVQTAENAVRMRALAMRLRGHAAETVIEIYRRKFEGLAAELEEAAVDTETRTLLRERFKLVS